MSSELVARKEVCEDWEWEQQVAGHGIVTSGLGVNPQVSRSEAYWVDDVHAVFPCSNLFNEICIIHFEFVLLINNQNSVND